MKDFEILKILTKTFGFKLKFIIILLFRITILFFIKIFSLIDEIFYFKYRKITIINPVFLIGHPRSGTTFLHRFLEKNVKQFRTMYLWEMVFPSIFLRKILHPFKNKLGKISLDGVWDPKIHKANFLAAETEDVALFFRYFEGFLSWLYFILWENFRNDEEFYYELEKRCNQDKFIEYLTKLHMKNLYFSKVRMFSKSFALIFNIDKIFEEFPDAKILLMIRNPIDAIASFLSLETKAQIKLNGFDKLDISEQERYILGVYKTSIAYYRKVQEVMERKDERIMFITYEQLLNDFEKTIYKVLSHFNVEITDELKAAIIDQAEKQKTYRTEHKYNLTEFGFSEEEVRKHFDFVNYNKI